MTDAAQNLRAHDRQIQKDFLAAGYAGVFAKKQGRACDGVALFWRTSRLRPTGPPQTWRLARTVHVALAQSLMLDGKCSFTAVATHLKAGISDEAEGTRVEQAKSLLQQLGGRRDAIVLADLNSHCRATRKSGTPPPEGTSGGTCAASAVPGQAPPSLELEPRAYPLLRGALGSAYEAVLGEEPSFTCWGGYVDRETRLVCDYILLKGSTLLPRRVLRVPDAAAVLAYVERLPNEDHPTDHVPLAVDLDVDLEAAAAAPPELEMQQQATVGVTWQAQQWRPQAASAWHAGWAAQTHMQQPWKRQRTDQWRW